MRESEAKRPEAEAARTCEEIAEQSGAHRRERRASLAETQSTHEVALQEHAAVLQEARLQEHAAELQEAQLS